MEYGGKPKNAAELRETETVSRPNPDRLKEFSATVYKNGSQYFRPMPWRGNTDPYWIFVSEIMLQQTQVPRVLEKFEPFIERYPSFHSLAATTFAELYPLWQGLGYNRRAKYLIDAATRIVTDQRGELPNSPQKLQVLPGIGPNTAASICVFAFNSPEVFIETNIRRVYIHQFFSRVEKCEEGGIEDRRILELVEATLDREQPREWYWALMDYGTQLAKSVSNPNRRSKTYVKQSSFEGSLRQVRGRIIRILSGGPMKETRLLTTAETTPEYLTRALSDLDREGMVGRDSDGFLHLM